MSRIRFLNLDSDIAAKGKAVEKPVKLQMSGLKGISDGLGKEIRFQRTDELSGWAQPSSLYFT